MAVPTVSTLKAQRRALIRPLRAALTSRQRSLAERRMVRKALGHPTLRRARDFGVYLATPHEAPTHHLIGHLLRRGQRVWVPVIRPGCRLIWVRYCRHTTLKAAALGIRQPRVCRPQRPYRQLQIIIVPLVAVDAALQRLGAGGGYYDRLPLRPHRRPRWLGWAFSAQCTDALPRDPWDRALDALITERRPQWPTG